jgi:hypothetical protein
MKFAMILLTMIAMVQPTAMIPIAIVILIVPLLVCQKEKAAPMIQSVAVVNVEERLEKKLADKIQLQSDFEIF